MSSDPFAAPRAKNGRAPDVFAPDAWRPMREYAENEPVDFAIVGTGAGGGTLACRLAEKGFSVVAFDAGPFFRPSMSLPPTRPSSQNSTGTMSASSKATTGW